MDFLSVGLGLDEEFSNSRADICSPGKTPNETLSDLLLGHSVDLVCQSGSHGMCVLNAECWPALCS